MTDGRTEADGRSAGRPAVRRARMEERERERERAAGEGGGGRVTVVGAAERRCACMRETGRASMDAKLRTQLKERTTDTDGGTGEVEERRLIIGK